MIGPVRTERMSRGASRGGSPDAFPAPAAAVYDEGVAGGAEPGE